MPFEGPNKNQLELSITRGEFMFNKDFEDFSTEVKDLVLCLISLDPDHRYTCKQALDHPWFQVSHEESVLSK